MAPEPRKETCPVCQRQIRLTRAGRIWNHQHADFPHDWCPGKGQMSVERATALARMEGQLHEAREKEKWSDSGG